VEVAGVGSLNRDNEGGIVRSVFPEPDAFDACFSILQLLWDQTGMSEGKTFQTLIGVGFEIPASVVQRDQYMFWADLLLGLGATPAIEFIMRKGLGS